MERKSAIGFLIGFISAWGLMIVASPMGFLIGWFPAIFFGALFSLIFESFFEGGEQNNADFPPMGLVWQVIYGSIIIFTWYYLFGPNINIADVIMLPIWSVVCLWLIILISAPIAYLLGFLDERDE